MDDDDRYSQMENPILHVLVIGFHHKKGCQVEYSYPPLVEGKDSSECPLGWKYLPTLALPDGSHNFIKDTVYFHVPSLVDPKQTVFGISCFRQIPVEKLKNRTADITRGTVQKSVCVLSSVPLYGHIQVKMELVTEAYFMEGDFTKVLLLNESYHHLNKCLTQIQDLRGAPQLYVGLSARNLILQFRHKTLLLFKLLLLERRVIFYRSPVEPLCATILSLLSLHPGMIENGLFQCACVKTSRPMSPIPQFIDTPKTTEPTAQPNNKIENTLVEEKTKEPDKIVDSLVENHFNFEEDKVINGNEAENVPVSIVLSECLDNDTLCDVRTEDNKSESSDSEGRTMNGSQSESVSVSQLQRDTSMDALGEATAQSNIATIAHVNAENCGTPLDIFAEGYLCLPYLSLPYMDLLLDDNVRGYIVGATNILFKQKKNIAQVLIEVESAKVETSDLELRRLLHLSTEDLRFADFLVRHVAEERHDVFVDGVGWEGGDEWIRAQFRVYLLCLLRTSLLQEGSRELVHFNSAFVNAWKDTHNYKAWLGGPGKDAVLEINPGHPFAGQLSVADMKLMLSHTMQNTEGGRKLNQAMVSTGRAVATTGRAVGGALSQAKGAFSNWWSNLTTAQSPTDVTPEIEPKETVLEENVEKPIIEV